MYLYFTDLVIINFILAFFGHIYYDRIKIKNYSNILFIAYIRLCVMYNLSRKKDYSIQKIYNNNN